MGTKLHYVPFPKFIVLTLACLTGCSSDQSPRPSGTASADLPHVEVLLGKENYQKVAPLLATGKKLKFRGEVALFGSKGKKVVFHLAQLYDGDQAAVQAPDFTKEFMTNRAAAEKKYNLTQFGDNAMILEGVVSQVDSDRFIVRLSGHTK